MKQAQRKTEVDTSDSVFTIFDAIRLSDFKKGHWNTTQRIRSLKYLESVKDKINEVSPSLHIITGIKVNLDTEEGHSIMQRYAEDNVAMGYEGIMVKDVDAPYQCKRGTAWMKWKPNITVDLQITDMEEGTGRNVGRLGALVCQGEDQGRDIFTNVGSGLSDEQRDEFWANKDSLIGSIVEIKADVVTQNQNGTYSLRFPRFLRFRDLGDGVKL
jgi:DNA ligase-1